MQIFRSLGLVFLSFIFSISAVAANANESFKTSSKPESTVKQQLVESVDIQGNRRLRDEDLLYYIKTRPGDTFNPQQLERDLKELLSLNFFDKTKTRVLTEEGPRGGVNVIFEVRELLIIRDLQFEGAKALQESDILKEFREKRVGISKEAYYNPVNVQKATRVLRELLAAKGYPNAKVEVEEEEVSATSTAITFVVDQGNRSRIIEIEFEGNEIFSDKELRNALELVKKSGLISRFKGMDILHLDKLQYDLQVNVKQYMSSKGYFRAQIGEPKIEGLGYKRNGFFLPLPILTSKDDTLKIVVPITEGKVYRVGDLKVEGNSIFSEQQIFAIVGLKKGEIVNGKHLRKAIYEDLKTYYGGQGFVLYDAEFEPEFKDDTNNLKEGIVNVNIRIDEGKQFRLRRLEFTGNTFTRDRVLRREMLLNEGEIYNQIALERSVLRLNQTQYFDPIDKDKDVEVRTDEENGDVDLILKVKERGRQQIQFNGGVSGLSGSFFGLEYSTNNLLGRGETLALSFGFGNRQKSFQLSFQEPYFRDRPITVGFSLFGSSYKFFGEGTFLSQNEDAIIGGLNPFNFRANDENLFTQTTYGASVFATTQLSELLFKKRAWSMFSRIGLTYQFSATSIQDPPVNASNDPTKTIPIVFAQPNITTSRVTGSFVYDTRQPSGNGIDMWRGKQLAVSLALSGLGGDVRTYQPSVVWSHFIPVRRRNNPNSAEVFAYRIQAGTIGSFSVVDKIRNANSLAFINGIPFYERYFLGSEMDVRGYETRSIGPVATINGYLTTQNVVLATNATGTPELATGVNAAQLANLISQGTFTGEGGANPTFTSQNSRVIGGDTQFLGNFEYRIPIFGPVMLAAFADVGTVYNRNKGEIQRLNSNFLPDQPFLGSSSINNVIYLKNFLNEDMNIFHQDAFTGAYLVDITEGGVIGGQKGNVITRQQYTNWFNATCPTVDNVPKCPDDLKPDDFFKGVYLRGNAQTNTVIDVGQSKYSGFRDIASSLGLELRVQVPVVNVPFRLIYYFNPNVRHIDVNGFSYPLARRNGFRFTVGRTF